MGYRKGNYRRSYARTAPRSRWMVLRYAGVCKVCQGALEAGVTAFWDASARTVTCQRMECCEADGLATDSRPTGPWDGPVRRVRAESRVGAAAPDPFARTRSRGYYGLDAGRCEDAPCCGCCD